MSWPPTPPDRLDLSNVYGIHFPAGTQDDEGVVGVNICIEAQRDCAGFVAERGPMTLEEMRQAFVPKWGFPGADLGMRALGYHGTGCQRYGTQDGYGGAGRGDMALTEDFATRTEKTGEGTGVPFKVRLPDDEDGGGYGEPT